ncbi:hypothetical protein V4U86_27505 [Mycobacterium sp. AMU20-3851]|uniref:hypothetical protein n=1 Tax=Mycobacterium sp. AMU20-3851 TaxID=3122055 RepID=UPI0037542B69
MTTATITTAALTISAPVPTPPALLAQEQQLSQRAVDLTAASTPYRQAQNVVNTLLPALVNTFGAQPTVTLDTLLAKVPASMLTDLLNANGNTINVATLLGTLGLNTAGSDLNTAVTEAISAALTDFLASATTGENAVALEAELRAAIAGAVDAQLRAVSVSVKPVSFLPAVTIRLVDVVGSAGVTNIANGVAGSVAGSIVNNLTDILPTADELTAEITGVLPDLLTTLFSAADLADAQGNFQLGNLLELVGLNLSTLADSGALTMTTAGPLFTMARLLAGVDLGWVPGTQSAIAESVNSTGYLDLGTSTLKANLAAALADALADGSLAADLGTVLTPALNNVVAQIVANATDTVEADLTDSIRSALSGLNFRVLGVNVPAGNLLFGVVQPLLADLADDLSGQLQGNVSELVDGLVESGTGSIGDALNEAVNGAIDAIPDQEIASVRIPIVIGTGMGAFSAGAAYRDVLAQLSSQPGGVDYVGGNPLLGSLTILPAILLNNAGRANGGIMARFASLFAMLGIDAVTPDVAITSSGGTPIGDTGLSLGGANLVPVKIDATVEYQLMSDFAAWANPATLVNNLVAGLLPTYMLRGLDVTGAAGQLTSELEELIGSLADQNAADTNIYLTVRANSLPMLEPLYLVGDVLRLAGLAPVANVVNGLANALSPALTSLVNLGYSDAFFNPETGAYERTLDSAATRVQFGTMPNVDWGQVLPNVLRQLAGGFQKAMTTDNNTAPNALSSVGDLLNGNIGDVLSGLTGAADEVLADVQVTADETANAAGDTGAADPSANRVVAEEPIEQPAEAVVEEPVEAVEPEVKRLPKTPKRVREAAKSAAELRAAKAPADKAPKTAANDSGDSGSGTQSDAGGSAGSAGSAGQNAA